MKLLPLGDCLLIEPEAEKSYVEALGYSHVVVPEAFKTGPIDLAKFGRVQALGPKCGTLVKIGDRVIYGKYAYSKVELESGKYLALVREADLIAVVEPS